MGNTENSSLSSDSLFYFPRGSDRGSRRSLQAFSVEKNPPPKSKNDRTVGEGNSIFERLEIREISLPQRKLKVEMIQTIEFLFERKWAGGSSIWKKTSPTLPWLTSYAIRGISHPDSQENFSCILLRNGV
jgi:hypothetical protein